VLQPYAVLLLQNRIKRLVTSVFYLCSTLHDVFQDLECEDVLIKIGIIN
jgi:hypothetical protein